MYRMKQYGIFKWTYVRKDSGRHKGGQGGRGPGSLLLLVIWGKWVILGKLECPVEGNIL